MKIKIVLLVGFLSMAVLSLDISSLKPRVMSPRNEGKNRASVLRQGENSIALHSGYVLLKKGESVGKHNSGAYEELIIVLKGEGTFKSADGATLKVKAGETLYCPPNIEHDMTNTGNEDLEYVYVVTKAAKDAHS